jgi:uncharacterized RDD family membrane protein YckC
MLNVTRVKKFNASEWVTPEALNVTPNLLGMPLARPSKRALAIGLDAMVIGLLSSSGAFWLLAGIAVVLFQLKKMRTQSTARNAWLWLALLLLLGLASQHTISFFAEPDTPTSVVENKVIQNTSISDLTASTAASASTAPPETDETNETDAERIATLERELKLAQLPKTFQWRDEIENWSKSLGLSFGWAIAYFTFLPYWWKGQTLGKKVFGLRVVELTGKPLNIMNCLGRYGGYAAGMATGMIGFVQVLWDVNRQAIQDKIAHTVVIDLRQARRLDLVEETSMKALEKCT